MLSSITRAHQTWCRRPDLNRHERSSLPPQDSVSTNSTTSAYLLFFPAIAVFQPVQWSESLPDRQAPRTGQGSTHITATIPASKPPTKKAAVWLPFISWCRRRDLNPHELCSLPPQDSVSTNSTTSAYLLLTATPTACHQRPAYLHPLPESPHWEPAPHRDFLQAPAHR